VSYFVLRIDRLDNLFCRGRSVPNCVFLGRYFRQIFFFELGRTVNRGVPLCRYGSRPLLLERVPGVRILSLHPINRAVEVVGLGLQPVGSRVLCTMEGQQSIDRSTIKTGGGGSRTVRRPIGACVRRVNPSLNLTRHKVEKTNADARRTPTKVYRVPQG